MEGESEGQKHQCVVASHSPPTGDPACNPGVCPDWPLNRRPFGLQASTQSTVPHQPGQNSPSFMPSILQWTFGTQPPGG